MKRTILNFSAVSALVLLGAACGASEPVATEAATGSQPADGVSVPMVDDSIEELPVNTDDLNETLVGLDLPAAEQWAAENDKTIRVVKEDGQDSAVTMDAVFGRIDVATEDGSIVEVVSGDLAPEELPEDEFAEEPPAIDEEPPAIDEELLDPEYLPEDVDLDEIRDAVVGLDVAAAEAWAAERGNSIRVVQEDGEYFAVTMDYVIDRINVVVVEGVITDIEGVG